MTIQALSNIRAKVEELKKYLETIKTSKEKHSPLAQEFMFSAVPEDINKCFDELLKLVQGLSADQQKNPDEYEIYTDLMALYLTVKDSILKGTTNLADTDSAKIADLVTKTNELIFNIHQASVKTVTEIQTGLKNLQAKFNALGAPNLDQSEVDRILLDILQSSKEIKNKFGDDESDIGFAALLNQLITDIEEKSLDLSNIPDILNALEKNLNIINAMIDILDNQTPAPFLAPPPPPPPPAPSENETRVERDITRAMAKENFGKRQYERLIKTAPEYLRPFLQKAEKEVKNALQKNTGLQNNNDIDHLIKNLELAIINKDPLIQNKMNDLGLNGTDYNAIKAVAEAISIEDIGLKQDELRFRLAIYKLEFLASMLDAKVENGDRLSPALAEMMANIRFTAIRARMMEIDFGREGKWNERKIQALEDDVAALQRQMRKEGMISDILSQNLNRDITDPQSIPYKRPTGQPINLRIHAINEACIKLTSNISKRDPDLQVEIIKQLYGRNEPALYDMYLRDEHISLKEDLDSDSNNIIHLLLYNRTNLDQSQAKALLEKLSKHPGFREALIEPNAEGTGKGKTPLYIAIEKDRKDLVDLFRAANADLGKPNRYAKDLISAFPEAKQKEITENLEAMQNASPDYMQDFFNQNKVVLQMALAFDGKDVVEKQIKILQDLESTPAEKQVVMQQLHIPNTDESPIFDIVSRLEARVIVAHLPKPVQEQVQANQIELREAIARLPGIERERLKDEIKNASIGDEDATSEKQRMLADNLKIGIDAAISSAMVSAAPVAAIPDADKVEPVELLRAIDTAIEDAYRNLHIYNVHKLYDHISDDNPEVAKKYPILSNFNLDRFEEMIKNLRDVQLEIYKYGAGTTQQKEFIGICTQYVSDFDKDIKNAPKLRKHEQFLPYERAAHEKQINHLQKVAKALDAAQIKSGNREGMIEVYRYALARCDNLELETSKIIERVDNRDEAQKLAGYKIPAEYQRLQEQTKALRNSFTKLQQRYEKVISAPLPQAGVPTESELLDKKNPVRAAQFLKSDQSPTQFELYAKVADCWISEPDFKTLIENKKSYLLDAAKTNKEAAKIVLESSELCGLYSDDEINEILKNNKSEYGSWKLAEKADRIVHPEAYASAASSASTTASLTAGLGGSGGNLSQTSNETVAKNIGDRLDSISYLVEAIESRQYSQDRKEDLDIAQNIMANVSYYIDYIDKNPAAKDVKLYQAFEEIQTRLEDVINADANLLSYHADSGEVVVSGAGQSLDDAINDKITALMNGQSIPRTASNTLAISDADADFESKTTGKQFEARVLISSYQLNDPKPTPVAIVQIRDPAQPGIAKTELRLPPTVKLDESKITSDNGIEFPNQNLLEMAKDVVENQMRIKADKSKSVKLEGNPALVEAAKVYCEFKGYNYLGKGAADIIEQAKALEEKINKNPDFLFSKPEEAGLKHSATQEKQMQQDILTSGARPAPKPTDDEDKGSTLSPGGMH